MRRQREYMLERRAAERNEEGREGMRRRQVTLAWVGRGALAGQITPDLSAVVVVVVPSGNNGHRSRAVRWTDADGQVGTVRALVRPPGWFSLRASERYGVLGNRICFPREIKEVGRVSLARMVS